jgi:hypothetical protein
MFRPLHWPSSGWHLTNQETIQYVLCTLGILAGEWKHNLYKRFKRTRQKGAAA